MKPLNATANEGSSQDAKNKLKGRRERVSNEVEFTKKSGMVAIKYQFYLLCFGHVCRDRLVGMEFTCFNLQYKRFDQGTKRCALGIVNFIT